MKAASEVSQSDMTVENLDPTTADQVGDPSTVLGQDTSGSSVKSSRSRAKSPGRPGVDEGGRGSNGSTDTSLSTSHIAHSLPQITHPDLSERVRAYISKVQRKVSIA